MPRVAHIEFMHDTDWPTTDPGTLQPSRYKGFIGWFSRVVKRKPDRLDGG